MHFHSESATSKRTTSAALRRSACFTVPGHKYNCFFLIISSYTGFCLFSAPWQTSHRAAETCSRRPAAPGGFCGPHPAPAAAPGVASSRPRSRRARPRAPSLGGEGRAVPAPCPARATRGRRRAPPGPARPRGRSPAPRSPLPSRPGRGRRNRAGARGPPRGAGGRRQPVRDAAPLAASAPAFSVEPPFASLPFPPRHWGAVKHHLACQPPQLLR